jgi:hypothetical protein
VNGTAELDRDTLTGGPDDDTLVVRTFERAGKVAIEDLARTPPLLRGDHGGEMFAPDITDDRQRGGVSATAPLSSVGARAASRQGLDALK